MQTTKNLYKFLGLHKEASQEDIHQAHRRLVRKYHPDTHPGDPQAEERFKEVQQAYEVLSDPRSGVSTTRGYTLPLERGAPAGPAQELLEQTLAGHALGVQAEVLEEEPPTP